MTYPEVGATRDPQLPPGYHHVIREFPIGRGRPKFAEVADALFGWQMHRRAGLTPIGPLPRAAPGVEVAFRFLFLRVPCRVVWTVEEDRRRGFAYGTLPGHPESGEEAFVLDLDGDDRVWLRIRAFSRPATLVARAGGPLTRLVQQHITTRYGRALR